MSIKCFYCHDTPKKQRNWEHCDYIQILAIDPARLNLALRVERRYISGKKRGDIETILFWKKDFTKNTMVSIIEELEKYSDIYIDTHVFIVERQMKKIEMLLIMQHLLTYFITKTLNYPLCPDIIEISAKVKGKQLGYSVNDRKQKGKAIKKWSIDLAKRMLEERDDQFGLEVMDYWLSKEHAKNVRKIDDICDAVLMIESYCQIKFNNYHEDMINIKEDRIKNEQKSRKIKIKSYDDKDRKDLTTERKRIKIKMPKEPIKTKRRIKIKNTDQ